MVCRQCGAVNAPEDSFCGNCGQPLPTSGLAAQHHQGTRLSSPPGTPAPPRAWDTPTIRAAHPPGATGEGMGESDWNAPTQAVQAPRTPAQPPVAAPDPWAQQRPISPYPPPAPTWNGPAYQQPQPPPVSQAALSPRRKPRRWPWYFLLTLVILAGIISATWLLFLRPIVHQDAETQIRRGLQAGVNQVPVSVAQDAQAGVPFLISEDQMNTYLASQLSNLAPISEIHVSLQPGVMVVTLNTFGLGSTVRLGLGLEDGRLVAQQVDVSGLLWWVENGSELTPLINDSLRQVQDRLGRPILAVSIQSGTLAAIFN